MEYIDLGGDLTYSEGSIKILDSAERVTRSKVIKMCKVQWSHHTEDEATWEHEEELRVDYPELFPITSFISPLSDALSPLQSRGIKSPSTPATEGTRPPPPHLRPIKGRPALGEDPHTSSAPSLSPHHALITTLLSRGSAAGDNSTNAPSHFSEITNRSMNFFSPYLCNRNSKFSDSFARTLGITPSFSLCIHLTHVCYILLIDCLCLLHVR
jgi:hypothetical protein